MKYFIFLFLIVSFAWAPISNIDWGFYGHRRINKMAVLTLPQEALVFYKRNIEYISAHAVDPDKRRYALKNEFARHYIDIDHWDTIPFINVPRDFKSAILKFGQLSCLDGGDTIPLRLDPLILDDVYDVLIHDYRYDVGFKAVQTDSTFMIKGLECETLYFENKLVQYGILPYWLEEFYGRLVWAFEKKDAKAILKISADIGHYIADGHVPLHTTENYNGQLTNQLGIHAFWESRLPELYADENYDFLVGKAEYIPDIRSYTWDFITESHRLLPDVLRIEKELSKSFPSDQQYCFDERLERTIKTQCPEYCEAYHNAMDGMVEQRMQDAVLAVGSFWYSAWVDAGQPNLNEISGVNEEVLEKENQTLDKAFQGGEILGREH